MDNMAYAVQLELQANTAGITNEINKSLNTMTDYQKQMSNAANASLRDTRRMIDQHKGLNKVLGEEATLFDRIGSTIGSIVKTIAGLAIRAVKAVASVIVSLSSRIMTYIDDARAKYSEMLEEFRTANIQAAGGVELLHNNMIVMMGSLGATREESLKTVTALTEAGFRAGEMGEEFFNLASQIHKYNRITNVSQDTTAKFTKSLTSVGFSIDRTNRMLEFMAEGMARGILTTSELTSIMDDLRGMMYQVEAVFGVDAVEEYAQALMDLSGAAKMLGVDISVATGLIKELNNNPLQFVVALGDRALYNNAAENMEALIDQVDNIRARIETLPPGLQPQLLKDIYGLDFTTLKVLEQTKEFRETYPVINRWSEMWGEANSNLIKIVEIMRSQFFAVFEILAQKFEKIAININKLLANVVPHIETLMIEIGKLIQEIFNLAPINEWGSGVSSWMVDLNNWIIKSVKSMTEFIKKLRQSEFIKDLSDGLYDIWVIIDTKLRPAAIKFTEMFGKKLWEGIKAAADILLDVITWALIKIEAIIDKFTSGEDKAKSMGETLDGVIDYLFKSAVKIFAGIEDMVYDLRIAAKKLADPLGATFGTNKELKELQSAQKEAKKYYDNLAKGGIEGIIGETKGGAAKADENQGFLEKTDKIADVLLRMLGIDQEALNVQKGIKDESKETNNKLSKDEYSDFHERAKLEESKFGHFAWYISQGKTMEETIEIALRNARQMAEARGEAFNEKAVEKTITGDLQSQFGKSMIRAAETVAKSKFGEGLDNKGVIDLTKDLMSSTEEEIVNKIKSLGLKDKESDKLTRDLLNRREMFVGEGAKQIDQAITYTREHGIKLAEIREAKEMELAAKEKAAKEKSIQEQQDLEKQINKEKEKVVKKEKEKDIDTLVNNASSDLAKISESKTSGIVDQMVNAALLPFNIGKYTGKLIRSMPMFKGEAAGTTAEHVATSAPGKSDTEKIQIDDSETMKKLVDMEGKQVDLLASIDSKIKDNLPRNNPSRDEVDSSRWI